MRGLIHKYVFGITHHEFEEMWPFDEVANAATDHFHDRQLATFDAERCRPSLYRRSIFGMIHVYNRLNQETVTCGSVKIFQRALTTRARTRCQHGDAHMA